MDTISLIPQPALIDSSSDRLLGPKRISLTGDAFFEGELSVARKQFEDANIPIVETPETPSKAIPISCLRIEGPDDDEGYDLTIRDNGIEIRASGLSGMYHGLQSIRQLILSGLTEDAIAIPCAEIHDAPRFLWRGFMLDTSRNFFSVAFIKKIIDLASLHHLNVFHWHLTDDQGWRLPVTGYEKLTTVGAWREEWRHNEPGLKIGGFYSREEIREIVRFAAERHVQVVPEVDLPGHSSAILAAYPELGCTGGPYRVEDRYGIFEDVLCAGNDRIFDLFTAVFDTLVELFPSPYVHIGGDEVRFNRWDACPKCQKRLKSLGFTRAPLLQSWITGRLAQMLGERGKTAIGWDEVLEDADSIPLPKELIVMSWRGQKGGLEASAKGHRVIMTPMTDGCYVNFKHLDNPEEPGHLAVCTVAQSYRMEPIPIGMGTEQERLVLGGQCNLWTEIIYASRIAEYMLFPRLPAIAEALWSPKQLRDLASFESRLKDHRRRLDLLDTCQYRGPLA